MCLRMMELKNSEHHASPSKLLLEILGLSRHATEYLQHPATAIDTQHPPQLAKLLSGTSSSLPARTGPKSHLKKAALLALTAL